MDRNLTGTSSALQNKIKKRRRRQWNQVTRKHGCCLSINMITRWPISVSFLLAHPAIRPFLFINISTTIFPTAARVSSTSNGQQEFHIFFFPFLHPYCFLPAVGSFNIEFSFASKTLHTFTAHPSARPRPHCWAARQLAYLSSLSDTHA